MTGKTYIKYILSKFDWMTFVFFLTTIKGAETEMVTSQYKIFQNKSSAASTVVGTEEVASLTDCASLCTANPLCKSFSINCQKLSSAKIICKQQSTIVTSHSDLVDSQQCFVQRKSVSVFTPAPSTTALSSTTVAPSTTAVSFTTVAQSTSEVSSTTVALSTTAVLSTTVAPSTSTTTVATTTTTVQSTTAVIDIVYGARNMCPGGSTNKDFLVLTSAGVYVFDEVDDLTSEACDGPVAFTTIFKNYPSIPTIDSVSGILIFQNSNLELYAGGTVYKWQIESGNLNSVLGSQSYSAHLGTSELDNVEFFWAAHRQDSSVERHFYLGGDTFFMKSDQHGSSQFQKSEVIQDMNNFNMNPWSDIPTNTAAVTGYGNEPNKNYALIDSAGNVYKYQLDHSVDNRNPSKLLTLQGQIQF